MINLKISERTNVPGETEGLQIIQDVQSSLNLHEQIFFFFFFVNNGELFHLTNGRFFLENLFEEAKINFEAIVDLNNPQIDFESVKDKVFEIFDNYIDENQGRCSDYFGFVALHLIKALIEDINNYEKVKRESKVCLYNRPINNDPIDLVGRLIKGCDLYECKHAASTQMDKIQTQINKLGQINSTLINQGYNGNYFLATIEFINKNVICDNIMGISTSDIINGEDVFGVSIKP
ncbi:hypothetical protein [Methanobacterium sp.]|uniref:hypothetical protein n=1 Tax=Methanobacterium sp. TaxID=2164 RepID=UPI003C763FD7